MNYSLARHKHMGYLPVLLSFSTGTVTTSKPWSSHNLAAQIYQTLAFAANFIAL